jgi:hypothetical protein
LQKESDLAKKGSLRRLEGLLKPSDSDLPRMVRGIVEKNAREKKSLEAKCSQRGIRSSEVRFPMVSIVLRVEEVFPLSMDFLFEESLSR